MRTDRALLWVLRGCALIGGGIVALVVLFLLAESIPALGHIGWGRFFVDPSWHPNADAGHGTFWIVPMITGTVLAAAGAVLIAAPTGILSALFCHYYASPFFAAPYRRVIELLAGIPSVVYGFWGLVVLVPMIGASLLAGILVLAIMVLPTIALMADAAFARIPHSLTAGASALGLSRWAFIRTVVLPETKSALFTGVILQSGRAVGETMAILMVCGNVARNPDSIFAPIRTLTSNIALEMAYALGDHRGALFVSGLLLLGMVTALVLAADRIERGRSAHA